LGIILLCLIFSCTKPEPKEKEVQTKEATTEITQIKTLATKQKAFSLQLQANGTIKALFSTYIQNKLAKTQENEPQAKINLHKLAS
jgi:hypothetical protein